MAEVAEGADEVADAEEVSLWRLRGEVVDAEGVRLEILRMFRRLWR